MPTAADNSRIFIKSYFASSVEEAIETARLELGPDALLVNSREAPAEARHLGECEVAFGIRRPSTVPCAQSQADGQLASLKQSIEELRAVVTRGIPPTPRPEPGLGVAAALSAVGISEPLAREIDSAVQRRLSAQPVIEIGRLRLHGWSADLVGRETVAEMESRFQVAPQIGRVAAFAGPPGSGKTTALVKLAVVHGLLARRPVRILSIDGYRIGAADQLRTYAAILGVPFTLVETTLALGQAIDSAPPDALILIDTPGLTASSMADYGQDLGMFFESRQDIDTHLVLTAFARPDDLQRAAALFAGFRPAKLLFTRLDETDSTASVFCAAVTTGLPLSFLCTGQLIPEEIEPATKAKVVAGVVRELPEALAAVA